MSVCTCASQICKGLLPMLYSTERKPDWKWLLNMVAWVAWVVHVFGLLELFAYVWVCLIAGESRANEMCE